MTDDPRPAETTRAKYDVIATLRRAGVGQETLQALERELPDPVDINRDGGLLHAHGITRDQLIDWAGGSP